MKSSSQGCGSNFSSKGEHFRCLDHNTAILCSAIWNSLNIGNILVVGNDDCTLRIYDLDNGVCSHILRGHSEAVVSVCVSSSEAPNPVVVSGSLDKTIIIWSMESGFTLRTLYGHRGVVNAVAVSEGPEQSVVVSCGVDGMVICWRLCDGEKLGTICGHNGPISTLALSDIKIPVIISGGDDGKVKVWELATGSLIDSLLGHGSEVNTLAVSRNPSNPIIVSGAADGSILVWDLLRLKLMFILLEGQEAQSLEQTPGSCEVSSVAVADSPQPVILSADWTQTVKVWDSRTGCLLRVLGGVHTRRVASVLIGSDELGPVLVTSGHDGKAVVWSPEEDLMYDCRACPGIEHSSLEHSIVVAGKYLCHWSLSTPVHYAPSGSNGSGGSDVIREECIVSPEQAALVFYCLLRLGCINPRVVRAKANALNYILLVALPVVDLLLKDPLLVRSPLQFLIDNRLCLQRAYEWMKIETNIERVISTLADPDQSADTLDSILTAVINDERLGGWDLLLPHHMFEGIFRNLVLNCRRSHHKIADMLLSRSMGVESQPYPSPLDVPRNKDKIVVRWNQVKQGKGIYCYRIRVNYHLPMDFLLSPEFLAAISDSDAVDTLVGVPLIRYLIQYKWDSWGYRMTQRLGIFYAVYLFSTTVSVLGICSGEFVDLSSHPSYILCICLSIFCNTLLMGLSLWEWTKAPSTIAFFSNLWHVSDAAMIVLCHVSIIVGTMAGPVGMVRVMSTLLTLLLWSHTLYLGRGLEGLSILIHTMKVIIWDVRYFMLVLVLFLTAFAVSFRVLGVFGSLDDSFLRLFNMIYGDLHFDSYFIDQPFPILMYLLFLICVVIILLNSLIAFMENSFRTATDTRHVAALVSRLRMITELEVKAMPFITLASVFVPATGKRKSLGDLVVLSPESAKKPDLSPSVSDSELLIRLNALTQGTLQSVDEVSSTLSSRYTNIEHRILTLESKISNIGDKIDQLLTTVSTSNDQSVNTDGVDRLVNVVRQTDRVVSYSYFGDDDEDK